MNNLIDITINPFYILKWISEINFIKFHIISHIASSFIMQSKENSKSISINTQ